MKKLYKELIIAVLLPFLMVGYAFAATYYMRAGGTAANKAAATGPCATAANCMSIATHNGETFSAGDTINLCDDGGRFNGQVTVPSSGSDGSPITYQPETGDTPVIAAVTIPTSGQWIDAGDNNWAILGVATEILQVYIDGTKGTIDEYPLDTALTWVWIEDNGGTIVVYSTENPATAYTDPGVEISDYDHAFFVDAKNYITVDGIIAEKSLLSNIKVQGADTTNFTVTDCTSRYGHADGICVATTGTGDHLIQGNTVHDNYGEAVHLYQTEATSGHENYIKQNTIYDNGMDGVLAYSNYTIIEKNKIYGNGTRGDGTSGIRTFDDSDGNGSYGDNNTICYNIVYSNQGQIEDGHGILLDHYSDNNDIYGNVAYDNYGVGIMVYKCTDANVYNNTTYDNGQLPGGGATVTAEIAIADDVLDRTENVVFKNNIGFATVAGNFGIELSGTVQDNTGISVTNNIWYRASGDWYQVADTPGDTLATWNAFAFVGTDLNEDPLFTDAANDDFTLKAGSPARSGAVAISGYDNRIVPGSSWPDSVTTQANKSTFGAFGITPTRTQLHQYWGFF